MFIYVLTKNISLFLLILFDGATCTAFTLFPRKITTKADFQQQKCFGEIGCVDFTSEWFHPHHRPVNLLPSDRYAVNTIFIKWFLNNMELTSEILGSDDKMVWAHSTLYLLVHDFTSNGYDKWIRYTSKALLERSLSQRVVENVVSVQWALGAEPPFEQAVANTRLVALEIIFFLDKMRLSNNLTGDNVHIIGHGLGAHVAGYVGKMRYINIITALDPTGPHFMKMPSQVRLHQFDAGFVEVVHTDVYPFGQGYPFRMGHADYYPNGGKKQPGCKDESYKLSSITRNKLKLGQSLAACSHKRSQKYYVEAIIHPTCTIVGIACPSYKEFLKGECTSCGEEMQNCRRLGDIRSGYLLDVFNPYAYYFVTSKSAPFCAEVIKAVIVLKPDFNSVLNGYFNVTIPQETKNVSFLLNENQYSSSTHQHHIFLVFRTVPPPITEPVNSVSMEWVPTAASIFRSSKTLPPPVHAFAIHKIDGKSGPWPGWLCVSSQTAKKGVNYNMRLCESDLTHLRGLPLDVVQKYLT